MAASRWRVNTDSILRPTVGRPIVVLSLARARQRERERERERERAMWVYLSYSSTEQTGSSRSGAHVLMSHALSTYGRRRVRKTGRESEGGREGGKECVRRDERER